ncbi:hypothetical protein B0T17DRAFT_613423 [Bombardia bombarda]|uniref:NmrA-like domain-containing protein n=1 Tax=Bombardia bombarda TaxID=252184 RepID=A0AA39XPF9_9PEZI|nr:hypothetical protein B0T17DRAFT_613423 [Bombardia bombarda]
MSTILAVFGAAGQQGSSIRAITRDVNSEKANALKGKNVEVVRGDVSGRASLETALTGAHTVFAVAVPTFGPDAKAMVEKYIRSLPFKSAFFVGSLFMENFHSHPFSAPQRAPDGNTWVLIRPNSSTTQLPLIDAVGDTGKFVGAILAEPGKYEGKTFCSATMLYSLEEVTAIMAKTTGKNVVFKQIPLDEFMASLPF